MSNLSIDLSKVAGPVYTGRDRGESLRAQYRLDTLDAADDSVRVVIPEDTWTVSSSFFLGLFGPSVRRLGSVREFRKKYDFVAPAFLQPVLDGHAALALQGRRLLDK